MSRNSPPSLHPPARPLLVALSGLSGVGKDAVLNGLKKSGHPLEFITTVTTRQKRSNEVQDIHYHFVSEGAFQQMIQRDELLEWAEVYGNYYGVPREPVKKALDGGRDVVVKVDVQGADTIKRAVPEGVFIFLTPPSMDELLMRLKQRGTESPADLELRLRTAEEELKQIPAFDYIVLNRQNGIDRAVADIEAIITAEKCRVKPREVVL